MTQGSQPTPRFVLIVGCQRSGTTLLGQMLGAHPSALLIDEDDGCYRVVAAICSGDPIMPVLDRVLPNARLKYSDTRQNETAMPSHIILKVPNATFMVDALRRSTMPLSFVFAIRDVREVVHSMGRLSGVPMIENQRRHMMRTDNIASRFAPEIELLGDPDVADHVKHATIWRIKNSLYREFCERPLSAILVSYQALVESPGEWIARLQAHVDMTPLIHALHHDTMHGMAIGLTDRSRPVDKTSQGKWKSALSAAQLKDIHAIADDLMTELSLPW